MLRSATCLLLLVAACVAEEVTFRNCNEKGLDDVGTSRNCSIHQVTVNPCREAAQNKPCRLAKGRSAGISFTYTPDESADELVSVASWKGPLMNAKFEGMDTDACHFTSCPVTGGQTSNYTFNLTLGRRIPTREYDVMWKLWNKGEERKFECCFLITIKIGGASSRS
ncbi:MD-2-related lipid-recognition protein-like [Schistocerca gregaria]|uniref:MD-2-related lipid-recognition protein-like n=1 Tax=Schistocerca gregaria TaxID=7010 RepID=UPI00211EEE49|nr:MD-2-related lipid-recognition protein-like [Schistocerca gregaria]